MVYHLAVKMKKVKLYAIVQLNQRSRNQMFQKKKKRLIVYSFYIKNKYRETNKCEKLWDYLLLRVGRVWMATLGEGIMKVSTVLDTWAC